MLEFPPQGCPAALGAAVSTGNCASASDVSGRFRHQFLEFGVTSSPVLGPVLSTEPSVDADWSMSQGPKIYRVLCLGGNDTPEGSQIERHV